MKKEKWGTEGPYWLLTSKQFLPCEDSSEGCQRLSGALGPSELDEALAILSCKSELIAGIAPTRGGVILGYHIIPN